MVYRSIPAGTKDMRTGLPAAYFAIKAFSETDMTEDKKKSTFRR
jgi:hypothetical protein